MTAGKASPRISLAFTTMMKTLPASAYVNGTNEIEAQLFKRERPGGRMLTVGGKVVASEQPIVLTEFGGIAYGGAFNNAWGYSTALTAEQLLDRYRALMQTVRNLPTLAGFCYTQFTDTYQESNGLLFADRTPKVPIENIAQGTGGPFSDFVPRL